MNSSAAATRSSADAEQPARTRPHAPVAAIATTVAFADGSTDELRISST
jgi:hypothetical protein